MDDNWFDISFLFRSALTFSMMPIPRFAARNPSANIATSTSKPLEMMGPKLLAQMGAYEK